MMKKERIIYWVILIAHILFFTHMRKMRKEHYALYAKKCVKNTTPCMRKMRKEHSPCMRKMRK